MFIAGEKFSTITVDSANNYYTVYNNILYTKNLTTLIRCPDNYISYGATIETPSALTTIASGAFGGWSFSGDYSITMNLHSNIRELNTSGNQYASINAFNIDSSNPTFTSVDGFIYSKDLKTLYAIPGAYLYETYSIPSGTETLYAYCGYGGNTIKTITIPSTVTSIGEYAFYPFASEEIVPLAYSTININSTSLSFTNTSFLLPEFESYTPTRTINVSDSSVRSQIAGVYTASNYNIN